jgi:hypothetical protein
MQKKFVTAFIQSVTCFPRQVYDKSCEAHRCAMQPRRCGAVLQAQRSDLAE